MDRVLLMGDIHGSYKPVRDLATYLNSTFDPNKRVDISDTLILLGDVGANFFFNHRDEGFKEKLGKYGFTYFIVRGNHEERPSNLYHQNPDKWHMEQYFYGDVYVENDYPYIKYAADMPFQYNIHGHSVLTLPGAYSVDKYKRLQNGWSWFKDEQMTEDEMNIGRMIIKACPQWDLVLSHTCPVIYEPTDLFLGCVDQSLVDKTMERYLGELERELDYKLWCWGHYHANRIYPRFDQSDRVMLFNDNYLDLDLYFEKDNPYEALIDFHKRIC